MNLDRISQVECRLRLQSALFAPLPSPLAGAAAAAVTSARRRESNQFLGVCGAQRDGTNGEIYGPTLPLDPFRSVQNIAPPEIGCSRGQHFDIRQEK